MPLVENTEKVVAKKATKMVIKHRDKEENQPRKRPTKKVKILAPKHNIADNGYMLTRMSPKHLPHPRTKNKMEKTCSLRQC